MKNSKLINIIFIIALLIIVPIVIVGCGETKPTFKVSFETNNGVNYTSVYVEQGKTVKIETPSRAEHTFGGWFTDEQLTETWNISEDTVQDVMTLYIKWLPHPILTYDTLGGLTAEAKRIVTNGVDGQTIELIPSNKIEKPGFKFLGWSLAIGGRVCESSINVDSNTTVYAKWQKKTSVNNLENAYLDTLAKLSELEYLAEQFKSTNNVSHTAQNLALAYIRGDRYNSTQWNLLAGNVNDFFVNYLRDNSDMDFRSLKNLGNWEPNTISGKVDFVHLIATLNMHIGSNNTNLLPDLGVWGGDLAQFANELKKSQASLDNSVLISYARASIANTSATFGLYDMNSDMDAVNIYRLMTDYKYSISKAFEVYYSSQVQGRRNIFKAQVLKNQNITNREAFVNYIKNRMTSNYYLHVLMTDSYNLAIDNVDARYLDSAIKAFAYYVF